jgi:hypothetical protein
VNESEPTLKTSSAAYWPPPAPERSSGYDTSLSRDCMQDLFLLPLAEFGRIPGGT